MELTLTPEEAEILADVLKSNLHELLFEISNTDSFEAHGQLSRRHQVLTNIQDRLARAEAHATPVV